MGRYDSSTEELTLFLTLLMFVLALNSSYRLYKIIWTFSFVNWIEGLHILHFHFLFYEKIHNVSILVIGCTFPDRDGYLRGRGVLIRGIRRNIKKIIARVLIHFLGFWRRIYSTNKYVCLSWETTNSIMQMKHFHNFNKHYFLGKGSKRGWKGFGACIKKEGVTNSLKH